MNSTTVENKRKLGECFLNLGFLWGLNRIESPKKGIAGRKSLWESTFGAVQGG